MAEEKKELWLNCLALTTVILAVCATLSTFKGGGYSTRSVLAQSQAADQWSYFQAKGIKGYLFPPRFREGKLQRGSRKYFNNPWISSPDDRVFGGFCIHP